MSNLINVLERIGQDAQLRHADCDALREMLAQSQVPAEVQDIIVAGKRSELETVLGATANVCCMIEPIDAR